MSGIANTASDLPAPELVRGYFRCPVSGAEIVCATDKRLFEQHGTLIAFVTREGGVSKPPFDTLNVGDHVGDDPAAVAENRARICRAFSCEPDDLITLRQVHGDKHLRVHSPELSDMTAADLFAEFATSCTFGPHAPDSRPDPEEIARVRSEAAAGADAIVVDTVDTPALLAFADCIPLAIVAPDGRFALVHCGWRGVVNGIGLATGKDLAQAVPMNGEGSFSYELDAMNVYIGPGIATKSFEVSEEVADEFRARYREDDEVVVYPDGPAGRPHVNLVLALVYDLCDAGFDIDRIVVLKDDTFVDAHRWFSYRRDGGVTGRHGLFGVRLPL